ncbi:hypothetical protein ACGFZG_27105 [Streptomyces antibioticus]|uniref:COG4315 family predicted lipoprotein n=1 Tax=Streptomyces antibioticus TaxID=1890 RepID=UPI0037009A45
MFRIRTTAFAAATAGILLLSACGGGGNEDKAASSESAANGQNAAAANDVSFKEGTAQENNADLGKGDGAPEAAPARAAKADKPVIRSWVQLTSGRAGALDPVVVNGKGFALYRFDEDEADPSVSNCSGDCAKTWPPLLVAGNGRVFFDSANIERSDIGFLKRDGAFQVTLAGWPVYLFSGDTKAGDTKGQGVGGTWFGVTPDGQRAGQEGGAGQEEDGSAQAPGGSGDDSGSSASPAESATFFDGPNFADPAEGLRGPGCKPVRFRGSVQILGTAKIWDGDNCTGRSMTVDKDVLDLEALGFGPVRSIRFAD